MNKGNTFYGRDVAVQDQTTRPVALRISNLIQDDLTLATDTVVDTRTITMTSGHGLIVGDCIILIEENGEPQYFFTCIKGVVVDVLTLDTLVPHIFTAEHSIVLQYDPELNKDGSATPYIAELRNPFSFPIDINKLIFHMLSDSPMDDALFGSLLKLNNGLSLRKNLSATNNLHYWNVKTNGALGELAGNKVYDDKAPSGFYGLSSVLTYNGQTAFGVAIRIHPGEAIQLLIQDNLTDLTAFTVMVEGQYTEGE